MTFKVTMGCEVHHGKLIREVLDSVSILLQCNFKFIFNDERSEELGERHLQRLTERLQQIEDARQRDGNTTELRVFGAPDEELETDFVLLCTDAASVAVYGADLRRALKAFEIEGS